MQRGDHPIDDDRPTPTMSCTDDAGGSFYLFGFNDEEQLFKESSSFAQHLMLRIIAQEEPMSRRYSCLGVLLQLCEEAPEPQVTWRTTCPQIWQSFWLACMEEKQLSLGLYTAVAMASYRDAMYMLQRPGPYGDLGLRAVLHYTSYVSSQEGVAALVCLAEYADIARVLYVLGWTEILSRLIARPLLDNADVPNHTTKLLALLCIERALEHDAVDCDKVLLALIELLKHAKPDITERAGDLVRAVLRKGFNLSMAIGGMPNHIDCAFKGLKEVQFDASRGGSHSRQSIIHAIYAVLQADSLPCAVEWLVQRTDAVSAICSVLILGPIEARLCAEASIRLLVDRCSSDLSLSHHFESLVAPLLPQLFGRLHFYLSELNTGTILKMISCSDALKREAIDFGGCGILEQCIRRTCTDSVLQGRLIMMREILSECPCVTPKAMHGDPQLSKLLRPDTSSCHPVRALRPVLRLSHTIWCKHKTLRPLADFLDSMTDCPASIASSTPPYELVYVNAAFCALTRYSIVECLGRNCRFLQRPRKLQDEPSSAAHTETPKIVGMADAMRAKQCFQVELTNFRSDGVPFQNFVTLLAVRTADGTLHYIGVQFDMNDYHARHRHLNNIELVVDFLQRSSATRPDPLLYGARPASQQVHQLFLQSHGPTESTQINSIYEEDESQEEVEEMVCVESNQKCTVGERCKEKARAVRCKEVNQPQERTTNEKSGGEWWSAPLRWRARTSTSRSDSGSFAVPRLHSRGDTAAEAAAATDAANFPPSWLPDKEGGSWDSVHSQGHQTHSPTQPVLSLQPPDDLRSEVDPTAILDDLTAHEDKCTAPPRLRPILGKSSSAQSTQELTVDEEENFSRTPDVIYKLRL